MYSYDLLHDAHKLAALTPDEVPGGDVAPEHEPAMTTALALGALRSYRNYLLELEKLHHPEVFSINGSADFGILTDQQAKQIGVAVDELFDTHMGNGYLSGADNTTQARVSAISNGLVRQWSGHYLVPRSRLARREDYQDWVNRYFTRYGKQALRRIHHDNAVFLNSSVKRQGASRLRVATDDILLVPTLALQAERIIESTGTTISRALPIEDFHTVYDLATTPNDYTRITIPTDVKIPESVD